MRDIAFIGIPFKRGGPGFVKGFAATADRVDSKETQRCRVLGFGASGFGRRAYPEGPQPSTLNPKP